MNMKFGSSTARNNDWWRCKRGGGWTELASKTMLLCVCMTSSWLLSFFPQLITSRPLLLFVPSWWTRLCNSLGVSFFWNLPVGNDFFLLRHFKSNFSPYKPGHNPKQSTVKMVSQNGCFVLLCRYYSALHCVDIVSLRPLVSQPSSQRSNQLARSHFLATSEP